MISPRPGQCSGRLPRRTLGDIFTIGGYAHRPAEDQRRDLLHSNGFSPAADEDDAVGLGALLDECVEPVGQGAQHALDGGLAQVDRAMSVGLPSRNLFGVEPSKIRSGAVFTFPHDERPLRILMESSARVLYDAWWPDIRAWGTADLQTAAKKKVNYYAVPRSIVEQRGSYVRMEPLDKDEFALHRPDLPLAVGQCPGLEWTDGALVKTISEMVDSLLSSGCDVAGEGNVEAAELYLHPFGRDGGQKAGIRVRADNGSSFSVGELLFRAMQSQSRYPLTKIPTQGIGIYRLGLLRGVPSYYLWSSDSMLS